MNLYESPLQFVSSLQNEEKDFENFQEKAKLLVQDHSYRADNQRSRKRIFFSFFKVDIEVELPPQMKFKTATYLPILDSLGTELRKRKEVYSKLQEKFVFLFSIIPCQILNLEKLLRICESISLGTFSQQLQRR